MYNYIKYNKNNIFLLFSLAHFYEKNFQHFLISIFIDMFIIELNKKYIYFF